MGLSFGIGKSNVEELAEVKLDLRVQLARSKRQTEQATSNLEVTTSQIRDAYLTYRDERFRHHLLATHRDQTAILAGQHAHLDEIQNALALMQRASNLHERQLIMVKCTEALQRVAVRMNATEACDTAARYRVAEGDLADTTRSLEAHMDIDARQAVIVDYDNELRRIFGESSSSHLLMTPREREECTFSDSPLGNQQLSPMGEEE